MSWWSKSIKWKVILLNPWTAAVKFQVIRHTFQRHSYDVLRNDPVVEQMHKNPISVGNIRRQTNVTNAKPSLMQQCSSQYFDDRGWRRITAIKPSVTHCISLT